MQGFPNSHWRLQLKGAVYPCGSMQRAAWRAMRCQIQLGVPAGPIAGTPRDHTFAVEAWLHAGAGHLCCHLMTYTRLAMQGQELVAFERFLNLRKAGGNHAHVNVLPIPAAAARQAPQVCPVQPPAPGCCTVLSYGCMVAYRAWLRC